MGGLPQHVPNFDRRHDQECRCNKDKPDRKVVDRHRFPYSSGTQLEHIFQVFEKNAGGTDSLLAKLLSVCCVIAGRSFDRLWVYSHAGDCPEISPYENRFNGDRGPVQTPHIGRLTRGKHVVIEMGKVDMQAVWTFVSAVGGATHSYLEQGYG